MRLFNDCVPLPSQFLRPSFPRPLCSLSLCSGPECDASSASMSAPSLVAVSVAGHSVRVEAHNVMGAGPSLGSTFPPSLPYPSTALSNDHSIPPVRQALFAPVRLVYKGS